MEADKYMYEHDFFFIQRAGLPGIDSPYTEGKIHPVNDT